MGIDAVRRWSAELSELEDKLRPRRRRGGGARRRWPRVDLRRQPLSERLKKAILERTAIAKPGMALYAPEDFEEL